MFTIFIILIVTVGALLIVRDLSDERHHEQQERRRERERRLAEEREQALESVPHPYRELDTLAAALRSGEITISEYNRYRAILVGGDDD